MKFISDLVAEKIHPADCCLACIPKGMIRDRMVVCPNCGNKRCPKASNHRFACTGSNEPGQVGSFYEKGPIMPDAATPVPSPTIEPTKWTAAKVQARLAQVFEPTQPETRRQLFNVGGMLLKSASGETEFFEAKPYVEVAKRANEWGHELLQQIEAEKIASLAMVPTMLEGWPAPGANPWFDAVYEGCVINFCDFDKGDAMKSLKGLLKSEIDMAMDPKISKAARDLMQRGVDEYLQRGVDEYLARNSGTAKPLNEDDSWQDGPPPSAGWWPTRGYDPRPHGSGVSVATVYRWWDGKVWSKPATDDMNAFQAGITALGKDYTVVDGKWAVRWKSRPSNWGANALT